MKSNKEVRTRSPVHENAEASATGRKPKVFRLGRQNLAF